MDLSDEIINDTLEALVGDITEKNINIAKYIRNLEVDTHAIQEAITQMTQRKKTIENRVKWFKKYMLENMQGSEISKISCPYFVITARKNPPAVTITNESNISKQYIIESVHTAFDKKKMSDDLKNGIDIDGAKLTQGWRLDIK